jgi:hypothetical protein
VRIKLWSTKLVEVIATDFQYTTNNCKVTLKVYVDMLLAFVPTDKFHSYFLDKAEMIYCASGNHVQQHSHPSTLTGSLFVGGGCGTVVDSPITSWLCIRLYDVTWRHHPPTQQEQPQPGARARLTRLYYIDCIGTAWAPDCMFSFDHATTLALWTVWGNT